MYKNERNNHIQKLSTLINTSGLGIFLVVGLNGCDGVSDDCKNLNNLPQYKVDECKNIETQLLLLLVQEQAVCIRDFWCWNFCR